MRSTLTIMLLAAGLVASMALTAAAQMTTGYPASGAVRPTEASGRAAPRFRKQPGARKARHEDSSADN